MKIARALEEFNILWLEEMLPQDNMQAYRHLANETRIPLCLSERLMTRYQFREVVEQGIARFVMPDICWCGGISTPGGGVTCSDQNPGGVPTESGRCV